MKKEKNFWDNLVKVLYIGLIIFICLLFMLITFSIKGHCASEQDYFPMEQNKNGNIPDNILTYIENNYNDDYWYICYFEKREENSFTPGTYYYYYMLVGANKQHGDNPLYCEINNDLIHFSLYNNSQNGLLFRRMSYFSRTPNNITSANTGSLSNWQNLISSNYNTSKDYVSNFSVFTNNNLSSRKLVLLADGDVYIPDGDTASEDMEKPEIDNYIPDWTNHPTFDNSSVESAIQSVYSGILWFGDNVKGTITGTGQYISDTFRWAIQKTINTIRSKIDEIKGVINDVKGFVSDIKDFVSYISEPLDVSTLQTTITSSTAFSDVSTITGSFSDFKAVFDNTSEPNEYKIPLHLENISILGQTQTQYIDLGIIASQRPLIRAFCWVVTTFSLFVTVMDALPNYIKGGDE